MNLNRSNPYFPFIKQIGFIWGTGFIGLVLGSLTCPISYNDPQIGKTFFIWAAAIALLCGFFQGYLLNRTFSTYAAAIGWVLVGISVLVVFPEIIPWDSAGLVGYTLDQCNVGLHRFSFAAIECASIRTLSRMLVLLPMITLYAGFRGAKWASDGRDWHLVWTLTLATVVTFALIAFT